MYLLRPYMLLGARECEEPVHAPWCSNSTLGRFSSRHRWAQFFTHFDFIIMYRLGTQQGKADALSRRSYMELRPGELAFEHQKHILLGPNRLRLMVVNAITTLNNSTLLDSIRDHMATDDFAKDVLDHIIPDHASCSRSKNPRNDYHQFYWHDGFLFRQNLLYTCSCWSPTTTSFTTLP